MSSKKILVVDDEPDVRKYLTRLLQENGYTVVSAADGNEAMAMAKSEKPDLITLDMSMPEKSGVRFFKELKSDPDSGKIPVIVVTGVTGMGGKSDDFKNFLGSRSQFPPPEKFVAKPIEQDEILSAIKALI